MGLNGLFDRFKKQNRTNEVPTAGNGSVSEKPEDLSARDSVSLTEKFLSHTGKCWAAMEDRELRFPYLDIKGDARLYFDEVSGQVDRELSVRNGNGDFHLKEMDAPQTVEFLSGLINSGIVKVLVRDGKRMEYLQVKDLVPDRALIVPDINNRSLRMMFIREMELSDRLRKLSDEERLSPKGKKMYETMLTLRFNAYRDMGHAVLYVAAVSEHKSRGSLYTPDALASAKERQDQMREKAPFVTLCFPGYVGTKEYLEPLNLCTAKVMDGKRVLPVFSDHAGADKFVKDLVPIGQEASVVAVTFREMMGQARKCQGIMLDMFGFGRIIMREDFREMMRWARCDMPIVVNIKDPDPGRNRVTVNELPSDISLPAEITAKYTGKTLDEALSMLSTLPAEISLEAADRDAYVREMTSAGCRITTREKKEGMLRTLVIRSVGEDRIKAVSIIRRYTGCSLADARALTEDLPKELTSPQALRMADELTAAGCDVLVKD